MSTELLSLEKETKPHSLPSQCSVPFEDSVEWTRPKASGYVRVKYVLDRIVAISLLALLWPLILVLWLAVKVTSQGAGFYLQDRVGLNGKVFRVIKLRSMCRNAEKGGKLIWSNKADSRVTPLGRILRKLHLDELPQLWNVARGDMSLVGPRPERPEITVSLEKLIPRYQSRHRVKPGITGLAQVNLEPDTNVNLTRKKQILDVRYIENSSLGLDLRLIFATSLRVFGVPGETAMEFAKLRQDINMYELEEVGYEFNTADEELWNPTKEIA